jgi:outer membrane protein OmpA-like peptidoglycan-associated protein
MDLRARILARRARFLAATLVACGPSAAEPAHAPRAEHEAAARRGSPAPSSSASSRPDADGDGIPDEEDACPGQPGSEAPWNPKARGCPCLTIIQPTTVVFEPKIRFAHGEATIPASAIASLTELRDALVAHPELRPVEVRGHRDAEEAEDLSLARARAVRDWLVAHGIEADRLMVVDAQLGGPRADDRSREVDFVAR